MLEGAVDAGDGQCSPERPMQVGVVPGDREQQRDRARGQTVLLREAGAVDDPHAGERDADRCEVAPDDRRPCSGRAAGADLRADRLEQLLGHEVVAVVIHLGDHRRQQFGLDLRDDVRVGRCPSEPYRPRLDPVRTKSPAKLPRGCQRRRLRDVTVVEIAVDRERRQRWALVDEEDCFPAGRGPSPVEPRLVAQHAAIDPPDPRASQLRREPVEAAAT